MNPQASPITTVATLTCKYCPTTFDSVLLIPEKAVDEVTKALLVHLEKNHPIEAKSILDNAKQMVALSVWLLGIGPHTTLLDEEDEEKLEANAAYHHFELQLEKIHELIGVEDMALQDEDESLDGEEEGDIMQPYDDEEDEDDQDEEDGIIVKVDEVLHMPHTSEGRGEA